MRRVGGGVFASAPGSGHRHGLVARRSRTTRRQCTARDDRRADSARARPSSRHARRAAPSWPRAGAAGTSAPARGGPARGARGRRRRDGAARSGAAARRGCGHQRAGARARTASARRRGRDATTGEPRAPQRRGGGTAGFEADRRDEDDPRPAVASAGDAPAPAQARGRDRRCRTRRTARTPARRPGAHGAQAARARRSAGRRRRSARPADVEEEIGRLAGRNANRALDQLMAGGRRVRSTTASARRSGSCVPSATRSRLAERARAHRPRAVPRRQLPPPRRRARGVRRASPTPSTSTPS